MSHRQIVTTLEQNFGKDWRVEVAEFADSDGTEVTFWDHFDKEMYWEQCDTSLPVLLETMREIGYEEVTVCLLRDNRYDSSEETAE
jgi:hypothetical protein